MDVARETRKAQKHLMFALGGFRCSREEDLPRGLTVIRVATDTYCKPKQAMKKTLAMSLSQYVEQTAIADFLALCAADDVIHLMDPRVWINEVSDAYEFRVEGYIVPAGTAE